MTEKQKELLLKDIKRKVALWSEMRRGLSRW